MTFRPAQQTDRHFDFLEMLDRAVVGCLWPAAEESMRGTLSQLSDYLFETVVS